MAKMHESTFQYLKPSQDQQDTMAHIRDEFAEMYSTIQFHVPEGRYKALAITALEESAMWANKGITRESDGSPREGATVE